MFLPRSNNFLTCACLSDSSTLSLFLYDLPHECVCYTFPAFFLHMHLSRSPPLSIALPAFAALPIPSLARFPLSFELSALSLRLHFNNRPLLQICHAARSHHKIPCKSMSSTAIPHSLHDHAKLSIPLGLSNSFIIFVPPPLTLSVHNKFPTSYSPHVRLSSRCCLLFYGHYSRSGLVTFSCAYHEFFFC